MAKNTGTNPQKILQLALKTINKEVSRLHENALLAQLSPAEASILARYVSVLDSIIKNQTSAQVKEKKTLEGLQTNELITRYLEETNKGKK